MLPAHKINRAGYLLCILKDWLRSIMYNVVDYNDRSLNCKLKVKTINGPFNL